MSTFESYRYNKYIIRAEDWLSPSLYVIDAQDPYTGDTHVILKSDYKIGWVLDENGG
jgi:hypothetical protein